MNKTTDRTYQQKLQWCSADTCLTYNKYFYKILHNLFQKIPLNKSEYQKQNSKTKKSEGTLTHKKVSAQAPVNHLEKSQSHPKEHDNVLACLCPEKINNHNKLL
jgi:hypothetical protein